MPPRNRSSWRLLVGACVLLAGCDSPAHPPGEAEDAELYALYQQAMSLQQRMEAAGDVLPEHVTALNALVDDVVAFQSRYGRSDVLLKHTAPSRPLVGTAVPIDPTPTPTGCRGPCPSFQWYSPTRICFLSEVTCDPDGRNTVCYYRTCLNFPIWFDKAQALAR